MVTYWEFLGSWGGTEELKSSKQWTQMWTELVKLHKDSNTSLGLTILDLDRRHFLVIKWNSTYYWTCCENSTNIAM